jgi:hypothetical protein
MTDTDTKPATSTDTSRLTIANRIHDLLLHELGESVDVSLLLGPAEYARAVLSLCRSCGSGELAELADRFRFASDADTQSQRSRQGTRYAGVGADTTAVRRLGQIGR